MFSERKECQNTAILNTPGVNGKIEAVRCFR